MRFMYSISTFYVNNVNWTHDWICSGGFSSCFSEKSRLMKSSPGWRSSTRVLMDAAWFLTTERWSGKPLTTDLRWVMKVEGFPVLLLMTRWPLSFFSTARQPKTMSVSVSGFSMERRKGSRRCGPHFSHLSSKHSRRAGSQSSSFTIST